MKKLVSIVFFLSLFTLGVKSQTYFNNEFSNDSSLSNGSSMVHPLQDTSGYLVVGQVFINSVPTTYLRFMMLDMLGDTVWTKFYGKYNHRKRTSVPKIISLGDTNFVFSGINYTDTLGSSTDSSLIVLYKIDLNGNVLWEFEYGDSGKLNAASDVQQTIDGGFIITGWTTGWGNVNNSSAFLLKVDSTGTEEWHKIYGGNDKVAHSVDITPTNGYIMAGYIYVSTATKNDIHVIKTDSLGNPIWSQSYGADDDDGYYSYVTDYNNSGDYIITSHIDVNPSNILDDYQGFIARISGVNGSIVWADTMGINQDSYQDAFGSEVIVLPNGDIVGVGSTYYQITTTEVKAWVIKYNSAGQLIWQRNFNNHGSNNRNWLYDIKLTYDGGYVACGDASDYSISEQFSWVLKLDSMGCQIVNCSVGIEEKISEDVKLLVYPNPSNTIVNFELSETSKSAELFLFDVTGKKVLVQKINSYSTQIDVSNYPKGIYFYQLIHQKERFSGKLVIN